MTVLAAAMAAWGSWANAQQTPSARQPTEITRYPGFAHVCVTFADGYTKHTDGKLYPAFNRPVGECDGQDTPLLFGVTQENERNTHNGSTNFDPAIVNYMSDYNLGRDLGTWLDFKIVQQDRKNVLHLSLDTIGTDPVNVTGWPLQYGHLFARVRDTVRATLDRPISVDFDIRLLADKVVRAPDGKFSGHRVLVGSMIKWQEASPRSNTAHFLEFDLAQSEGYSAFYGDPSRPACKDTTYDRCFYDPGGRYAEGRELSYASLHLGPPLQDNRWTHIHIPYSRVAKGLVWVSGPADWSKATLQALYIGVESVGATDSTFEIRNYHVVAEAPSPAP